MHVRSVAILAIALLATGCSCETEEVAPPAADESAVPASEDASAPPRATRDDLPAATPALTIALEPDAFVVDSHALVETWPASERARVSAEGFDPVVHERIAASDGSLLVAPLLETLRHAAQLERVRAGGAGTPIAYALRVPGNVPWRRVVQALHAAGLAGWSEPRFVLRAARSDGEVALAVPPPSSERATDPIDVAVDRSRAMVVRREGTALAPGCLAPGTDTPSVAPSADRTTDPAALARCLDAGNLRGVSQRATLAADGAIPFAEIAPVLELIRARFASLEIRATATP